MDRNPPPVEPNKLISIASLPPAVFTSAVPLAFDNAKPPILVLNRQMMFAMPSTSNNMATNNELTSYLLPPGQIQKPTGVFLVKPGLPSSETKTITKSRAENRYSAKNPEVSRETNSTAQTKVIVEAIHPEAFACGNHYAGNCVQDLIDAGGQARFNYNRFGEKRLLSACATSNSQIAGRLNGPASKIPESTVTSKAGNSSSLYSSPNERKSPSSHSVADFLEHDLFEKGLEVLDFLDDDSLKVLIDKVMDVANKLYGDYLERELVQYFDKENHRSLAAPSNESYQQQQLDKSPDKRKTGLVAAVRSASTERRLHLSKNFNKTNRKSTCDSYANEILDNLYLSLVKTELTEADTSIADRIKTLQDLEVPNNTFKAKRGCIDSEKIKTKIQPASSTYHRPNMLKQVREKQHVASQVRNNTVISKVSTQSDPTSSKSSNETDPRLKVNQINASTKSNQANVCIIDNGQIRKFARALYRSSSNVTKFPKCESTKILNNKTGNILNNECAAELLQPTKPESNSCTDANAVKAEEANNRASIEQTAVSPRRETCERIKNPSNETTLGVAKNDNNLVKIIKRPITKAKTGSAERSPRQCNERTLKNDQTCFPVTSNGQMKSEKDLRSPIQRQRKDQFLSFSGNPVSKITVVHSENKPLRATNSKGAILRTYSKLQSSEKNIKSAFVKGTGSQFPVVKIDYPKKSSAGLIKAVPTKSGTKEDCRIAISNDNYIGSKEVTVEVSVKEQKSNSELGQNDYCKGNMNSDRQSPDLEQSMAHLQLLLNSSQSENITDKSTGNEDFESSAGNEMDCISSDLKIDQNGDSALDLNKSVQDLTLLLKEFQEMPTPIKRDCKLYPASKTDEEYIQIEVEATKLMKANTYDSSISSVEKKTPVQVLKRFRSLDHVNNVTAAESTSKKRCIQIQMNPEECAQMKVAAKNLPIKHTEKTEAGISISRAEVQFQNVRKNNADKNIYQNKHVQVKENFQNLDKENIDTTNKVTGKRPCAHSVDVQNNICKDGVTTKEAKIEKITKSSASESSSRKAEKLLVFPPVWTKLPIKKCGSTAGLNSAHFTISLEPINISKSQATKTMSNSSSNNDERLRKYVRDRNHRLNEQRNSIIAKTSLMSRTIQKRIRRVEQVAHQSLNFKILKQNLKVLYDIWYLINGDFSNFKSASFRPGVGQPLSVSSNNLRAIYGGAKSNNNVTHQTHDSFLLSHPKPAGMNVAHFDDVLQTEIKVSGEVSTKPLKLGPLRENKFDSELLVGVPKDKFIAVSSKSLRRSSSAYTETNDNYNNREGPPQEDPFKLEEIKPMEADSAGHPEGFPRPEQSVDSLDSFEQGLNFICFTESDKQEDGSGKSLESPVMCKKGKTRQPKAGQIRYFLRKRGNRKSLHAKHTFVCPVAGGRKIFAKPLSARSTRFAGKHPKVDGDKGTH